jgi:hypothetical protein
MSQNATTTGKKFLTLNQEQALSIARVKQNKEYKEDSKRFIASKEVGGNPLDGTFSVYRYKGIAFAVPTTDVFNARWEESSLGSVTLEVTTRDSDPVAINDAKGVPTGKFEEVTQIDAYSFDNSATIKALRAVAIIKAENAQLKALASVPMTAETLAQLADAL